MGPVILFPGQVPRETYVQLEAVLDWSQVESVHVVCSGSFRTEQWLSKAYPHVKIHSGDISLLSSALGGFLAGSPLPMRFIGPLAWLEEVVAELGESPINRLAAFYYALQVRFLLSEHSVLMRRMTNARQVAIEQVTELLPRLQRFLGEIRIASFIAGDLRDAAQRGIAAGSVVFGFPPTDGTTRYRRDALFGKLEAAVEWQQPTFSEWKPSHMGEFIRSVEEAGGRYVLGAEFAVEGFDPIAYYTTGRRKPVHVYSNLERRRTSVLVRRATTPVAPRYDTVTEDDLVSGASVELLQIPQNTMAYLKDSFYKEGLVHSAAMCNIVVLINGKLAGGFSYRGASTKYHPPKGANVSNTELIYVLADFGIGLGHRRLSKLVCLLSSSRAAVHMFERTAMVRIKLLLTTAFSERPASMKYRDIFKLESRADMLHPQTGHPQFRLNYSSLIRKESPHDLYEYWLKRWGRPRRSP